MKDESENIIMSKYFVEPCLGAVTIINHLRDVYTSISI